MDNERYDNSFLTNEWKLKKGPVVVKGKGIQTCISSNLGFRSATLTLVTMITHLNYGTIV